MVWIPGGEFSMGTTDPAREVCGGPDAMDDARPVHRVYVDRFWMDITEVTNDRIARCVVAMGYVASTERRPRAEDYPGVSAEKLVAGSVVFAPPDHAVSLANPLVWWSYIAGADWRDPEGSGSKLTGRGKCPVVHIAYEDAAAYSTWAGKRLPAEAEREFAARGGQAGQRYTWGNKLQPGGKWKVNIWEGHFPNENTGADGFNHSARVASYLANGYGLYDMAGNVWEWCSDWYRPDAYAMDLQTACSGITRNPVGLPVN